LPHAALRSLFPTRGASAGLAVLALLAGDAFLVEPYRLEVSRYQLTAAVRRPVVLAHITDLHSSGFGRRERALLSALDAARPDVIAITGDSVPDHETGVSPEPVVEVLKRLRAPLGVFAVLGNWEHWRHVGREPSFWQPVGVTLLVNEAHRVRDDLWVVGIDDALAGGPDAAAAFAHVPENAARVVLMHSPEYFDSLPDTGLIVLAGHTHGGQVRVPGLRPLWLPPGCGPYVEGWYRRGSSRLFVSRGVGTSILRARFWCRPELALITLVPERP
jgi:predicted MPP superfamily phosphohydrolase